MIILSLAWFGRFLVSTSIPNRPSYIGRMLVTACALHVLTHDLTRTGQTPYPQPFYSETR